MANALDQTRDMAQSAIGKGRVGAQNQSGKVGVKIKAAIFFDGTGNNQSNIKKRLRDPSYKASHWYDVGDLWSKSLGHYESYEQYYSNVAILYFMHKKKVPGERIVSVYMEGIGTSNDGPDDTTGSAFGAGPTGIVARVSRGITLLASQVNKKLAAVQDSYLAELTVYVFGFSRGAAAARHFCARRANSQGRFNNLCRELGVDQAPLSIMLKLNAAVQSGIQFGNPNQEDSERRAGEPERNIRYVIPATNELFALKNQLEAYAMGQYRSNRQAQTPPSPQPLPPYRPVPEASYRWLRQRYLHLSWSDRLGFDCRLDDHGNPTRLIIAG